MTQLGGRRGGYENPQIMLADARRRAAAIVRAAEREAAQVRRDAAEWAATVRADAEEHRDQIYADLERLAGDLQTETGRIASGRAPERAIPRVQGDVIDLREAPSARRVSPAGPVTTAAVASGGGGQQVVETSIESKVYDVVVDAIERTFSSLPPS